MNRPPNKNPFCPPFEDVSDEGLEFITDGDAEASMPTINGQTLAGAQACAAVQSTDFAHSGSNSVKLTGNATSTAAFAVFLFVPTDAGLGLTDGQIYTSTCWVYIPSGQGIANASLAYSNDGVTIVTIGTTTTTDAWVKLQGSYTANSNAIAYGLTFTAADIDTLVCYFDDLSIR